MLINCPECKANISDKAPACPHCGFPVGASGSAPRRSRRNSNRRRRLPNGFGQITEIKGQHLRNPFRVMVCVGKSDEGKPLSRLLRPTAYFPTYNDAYTALLEYHRNPYDLDKDICVSELYEKWFEDYKKDGTCSASAITQTKSAWAYASPIYNMKVRDVRSRHLKGCIETGERPFCGGVRKIGPGLQARLKTVFNMMFDYAVEYELTDTNYARRFHLSKEVSKNIGTVKKSHIAFSEEEMSALWKNVDALEYVDAVLIQCYSGWRPQELCLLRIENINWEEKIFLGGMKTDAGEERIVPIHSKIEPLVRRRYDEAVGLKSQFLFNWHKNGQPPSPLNYARYSREYRNIIGTLGLNENHRPHDPRVQFVTMAKKSSVDEYALKRMIGHAIQDLTEKIYTKRDAEWLQDEIEKIK